MTIYDGCEYDQNDYEYDFETFNHTTDSLYSSIHYLGYHKFERLNAVKKLKTSLLGPNLLEQLHHKYGHMSAGAIKEHLKTR